jgi:D-glycero-D-manno-heptose 1,7-bisphosphate phosphatase
MRAKAVFLDKDGTLVEDIPYNVHPDLIRPVEGIGKSLRLLHSAGYQLIVVSNQSGVARGYFTEDDLLPTERWLRWIFTAAGASLAGFYYCPHHPQGKVGRYAVDCTCRKPKPGMLYQAAQELGIDLADSWMVGDILDDMEAGNRAGCRTVLIHNNHENEWDMSPWRRPDFVVSDLPSAARLITGEISRFQWNFLDESQQQRSSYHD